MLAYQYAISCYYNKSIYKVEYFLDNFENNKTDYNS